MISKIQLFLRLSIGALLLTHAFPELQAQTADEYFMLGNNAYASGDFARAKENYMSADKEKSAAEISYNLANTCAKLGDKGEAMLHYMRALYQNPRMREAEANMSVFAKDNSLETPDGIFTLPFFAELSHSEWAYIAFALFWIFILLLVVPPLYGVKGMATTFMAILSFAFFVFAVVAERDWNSYSNLAVAIKNDTKLKVSPVDDAPIASILQQGQISSIEKRSGNHIKVNTKSGKSGWASLSEMAPVFAK